MQTNDGDRHPSAGEAEASGDPSGAAGAGADPPGAPGAGKPGRRSLPEARELTRARARDLRELLARYIRRHLPPVPKPTTSRPEPPRAVGAYARLLPLLQLIPWLLAALFAFSFYWDFPGIVATAFGYQLELSGLLRILSVSGLIGFFTNWLAIGMLFHPRERRPIFGQGLIPAQRERVIYRLAKAVSEEIINEEMIKRKIEESGVITKYRDLALTVTHGVVEDPEFRSDLKALTASYLDGVLGSEELRHKLVEFTIERLEAYAGSGLGGLVLKTYRFLYQEDFQRRIEQAIRELPGSLDTVLDQFDDVLDRVPQRIEARSKEIEEWVTRTVLGFVEQLDFYDIIISNMYGYDETKLERLIKTTSNEQLNYIKYLGGILGCIGGLVIWRPFLALGTFAVVGGILIAVDEMLARRVRSATR